MNIESNELDFLPFTFDRYIMMQFSLHRFYMFTYRLIVLTHMKLVVLFGSIFFLLKLSIDLKL